MSFFATIAVGRLTCGTSALKSWKNTPEGVDTLKSPNLTILTVRKVQKKLKQFQTRSMLAALTLDKYSFLLARCCNHRKPQLRRRQPRQVSTPLNLEDPYPGLHSPTHSLLLLHLTVSSSSAPSGQRASPTRICGGTFQSNTSNKPSLARVLSGWGRDEAPDLGTENASM